MIDLYDWTTPNGHKVADMASDPWVVPHERQSQNLDDFPNLKRWFHAIKARPAVERAYAQAEKINPPTN
jgi:GST-like protein